MKSSRIPLILAVLLLLLAGCGPQTAAEPALSAEPVAAAPDASAPEGHSHAAPEESSVLEHEPAGYCGNTVTTVRALPAAGGEGWERSFWGGQSVTMTDLLLNLDYSGDVCRCPAEYEVVTELGHRDYGLNLTQGFARWEGGQTGLTAEQLETLRQVVAAAEAGDAGTELHVSQSSD